ncbi:MAG: helix-hairpin-helix domain-containing protein [Ignavibacterium sp.]|nr:helix-hairpin-helix domain-containing protein [Ignavibacterium sp.]
MILRIIFLIILLSSYHLYPQVQDTTITDIENELEDLTDFDEESESDYYDIIEHLLLNQIDLNSASLEDLISIPFLDLNSATLIINHREKFGKFLNVNELFSIKELNQDLILKIIPFLKVESKITQEIIDNEIINQKSIFYDYLSRTKVQIRSRVGSDLQTREGFIKGNYLGSKLKSYNRILIKYSSNFQLGLTTEKDAGEKDFLDFYSFHFSVNNYDLIKQLVLGDYNLEIAQGLILWNSYSFSKGNDAIIPAKKKQKLLRPYTSATEYNFFRGSAVLMNIYDFNFLLFYSSKKIDANIDDSTQEIKSFPLTGIHATRSDLLKKNSATETLFGSRLEYQINTSNKFGLTFYNSNFSNPIERTSIYDIAGKKFYLYSFDFDNRFGFTNIFGEIATDNNYTAYYLGFIVSPTNKFQFTSTLRKYPVGFTNIHSNGFGEQSGKTQNEFGIYSGIKFNSQFGLFNIYYDKFKFPYKTFENTIPSSGDEFLISFRRKLTKEIELHIRFKTENKEVTEAINNLKVQTERIRNSHRLEIDYFVNKNFKLRTRVEYNTFKIEKINLYEKGFLIYEDIKISPIKDLIIYARLIFFDTNSFNSAIYEYENDLTGLFTNLAMYGEGIRYYLMLRYKIMKNILFSFKYAETYKPNEKFLSSGNNRINGNVDNRINFQVDVNL